MVTTNNPYDSSSVSTNIPLASLGRRETSNASWVAIFCPLFIQMFLTCGCGHLHLYILPITLMILGFAIHACSEPKSRTLTARIGLAVALLFFGKHVADILWLGHEPLLIQGFAV